jgi:hypothetical protein
VLVVEDDHGIREVPARDPTGVLTIEVVRLR